MRTAEGWISVIDIAGHIGAAGELERQIKRIQADALMYAADECYKTAHVFSAGDSSVLAEDALPTVGAELERQAKALDPQVSWESKVV